MVMKNMFHVCELRFDSVMALRSQSLILTRVF